MGTLFVSWNVLNKCENNVELFCKGYFTNSLIFKNIILDGKKITVKYKILEIKFDKYLFKLHLALPINKNKIIFQYDYFKKVDENFGNIVTNNGIENFLTDVTTDQGSNDFLYFYGVNGKIEIQDGDFNSIFLNFDKKYLPYFWIFQSRGGWNDLNVNVLEPCNSGLKDIESARIQFTYSPPNHQDLVFVRGNLTFDVLTVIRCLNENENLKILIPILLEQRTSNFEIIFVDSGSTDGSLETIQNYVQSYENITLTCINKKDFTFGRSLNIGFKKSKGEIIFSLSAQCFPKNNYWLESILEPQKV